MRNKMEFMMEKIVHVEKKETWINIKENRGRIRRNL